MASKYISVEVSLDEFSDEELHDELVRRGCEPPASFASKVARLWEAIHTRRPQARVLELAHEVALEHRWTPS